MTDADRLAIALDAPPCEEGCGRRGTQYWNSNKRHPLCDVCHEIKRLAWYMIEPDGETTRVLLRVTPTVRSKQLRKGVTEAASRPCPALTRSEAIHLLLRIRDERPS